MLESRSFVQLHTVRKRLLLRHRETGLSKVRLPASSEEWWTNVNPYANGYSHLYTNSDSNFTADGDAHCHAISKPYAYRNRNANSYAYRNTDACWFGGGLQFQ